MKSPEEKREYNRLRYLKNRERICAASLRRSRANPEANRERAKQWALANPERVRRRGQKYRQENAEKVREAKRQFYLANAEKIRAYWREYRRANAEKVRARKRREYLANNGRERQRQRYWANPDKHRAQAREWQQRQRQTNPQAALTHNLRTRIGNLIAKGDGTKAASTLELLGCTLDKLMQHLERQFVGKMSWANRGRYWHVDHIRPLASFDLTDPEQQKSACNYLNLRPLRKRLNLSKGARLTHLL